MTSLFLTLLSPHLSVAPPPPPPPHTHTLAPLPTLRAQWWCHQAHTGLPAWPGQGRHLLHSQRPRSV